MIIKKKGNAFVAYRTEKGEHGADFAEAGSEIGRISITTGKFSGGTGALVELNKHLREYLLKSQKEKFFLYDMTTGELQLDLGEITQDEADKYEDGSLRAINEKEHVINQVIAEMRKDFDSGDVTAIDELLKFIPIENLKSYLPEKL